LSIEIPSVFKTLFKPKRYNVYYGGRGSGKSQNIARVLIIEAIRSKKLILCTREFQGSIKDSVHRILSTQIDIMGYSSQFEVQATTIRHKKTGSEFIFEGLKNNVTKVKSMAGVDICWAEEADAILEYSWDVLLPTIRKPNSYFVISFNPHDEQDNTYQRFIVNPPKNSFIKKVNYTDNPFFPKELREEMEEMKERNYRKYLHIWEGECSADFDDSIILPEWIQSAIDAHIKLGFEPLGTKALGFDPADVGKDAKAITVRHGSVITKLKAWLSGNIDDGINQAFSIANDEGCQELVYDSIGVGASLKVGLEKRIAGRKIRVTGFGGGDKVDNPDEQYYNDRSMKEMFRNKRAQYWWLLRDRFEKTHRAVNGEYIDPDELISLPSNLPFLSELSGELSRVQRKRTSSMSLIQLESKPDMLKRGVKSPNLADALVMCFATPPPLPAIDQSFDNSLEYSNNWIM